MKPRIVLSGVNFVEAGPLSIFRDALKTLSMRYSEEFEIVALVHTRELFAVDGVTYLEFPEVKRSWWRRLRFEYWDCRALSRGLQAHLWLALHDMTPNIEARISAVYCHNPAPFGPFHLRDLRVDPKFMAFKLLYRRLYRINLRRNDFVVVQQEWLRREFRQMVPLDRIVVAHPSVEDLALRGAAGERSRKNPVKCLFYPAYPRSFKNFEVLLQAFRILEEQGFKELELWLTLDGLENTYSRNLKRRYGRLRNVRWMGRLPRECVLEVYGEADGLIFPSRLETWGMPISEFQQTGKPMLVADLPYAHETVGSYPAVSFFDPADASSLAHRCASFAHGSLEFQGGGKVAHVEPYAATWDELFRILLGRSASAH